MKRRAVIQWLMTGPVLAGLSGCSRGFAIHPRGSLAEGVTFYFTEGETDDTPARFSITELLVQSRAAREWQPLWELRGEVSSSEIVYGRAIGGLVASAAAVPIEQGRHYRVLATAQTWSARAYASKEFSLDATGAVREQRTAR